MCIITSGSQEFLNTSEEAEDDIDGTNAAEVPSGYIDDPGYDVMYAPGGPTYNSFDDYDTTQDQQSISSMQKKPAPPSPKTAAFQAVQHQNVLDYGYSEPIPVHKDYHSSLSLQPDQISMHSSCVRDSSFVTNRAKMGKTSDTFI